MCYTDFAFTVCWFVMFFHWCFCLITSVDFDTFDSKIFCFCCIFILFGFAFTVWWFVIWFSAVTNLSIFTDFVFVVCYCVICFHWCCCFLYLDWYCIWCSLICEIILLLWMVSFFWRISNYLFTNLWYYFSPIANLSILTDFPFTNFSLI